MPRRRKVRVRRGPAAKHEMWDETIYEFSGPNATGGLIAFTVVDDTHIVVDLYRLDPGVTVRVDPKPEGM